MEAFAYGEPVFSGSESAVEDEPAAISHWVGAQLCELEEVLLELERVVTAELENTEAWCAQALRVLARLQQALAEQRDVDGIVGMGMGGTDWAWTGMRARRAFLEVDARQRQLLADSGALSSFLEHANGDAQVVRVRRRALRLIRAAWRCVDVLAVAAAEAAQQAGESRARGQLFTLEANELPDVLTGLREARGQL